jgi:hypothetical protein
MKKLTVWFEEWRSGKSAKKSLNVDLALNAFFRISKSLIKGLKQRCLVGIGQFS